jgi:hypothetical protein
VNFIMLFLNPSRHDRIEKPGPNRPRRGFALVATLMMLILLAVNPLFPFPERLSSVFSALDEKANS